MDFDSGSLRVPSPDGSSLRFLTRRCAWALAVIWVTLTVCFAVIWLLPDERMVFFSTVEMGLAATDTAGASPLASYASWMIAFLTFDWGQSVFYQQSVVSLYVERLPVTLAYLLPQLLVSIVVGTWVTTYAATDRERSLHDLVSTVSILGLSIPSFLAAWLVFVVMPEQLGWTQIYDPDLGLWSGQNLLRLQVPGLIVGLSFLGVQIRHTQSETAEHLELPFVKTARAKGAGRWRITAHVFRNIWPSLASLALGEAVGILLLSVVVVEEVFDVPGIAVAVFNGFAAGDPMVTFTAVFGLVFAGVCGTLARDFARVALDPQYDG
jgi:peptide/nickel transport system permease protein